jgi:hypothetical protein
MTFDEALKRLAEKYPEKFDWVQTELRESLQMFRWGLVQYDTPQCLTQDDIDSILALIGKRFLIRRNELAFVEGQLLLHVDVFNLDWQYLESVVTGEEKLEAAKAALIAVVEKETP